MELNEFNKKAIEDTYKNAHIALQSISDILPSVEDNELRDELKEEYDGYEKLVGKISSFMAEKGLEAKSINPVKKAFMWGSIKMKTAINNSRNQIADMMIKGTVMGISELTAMKNESQNLDEEVKNYIDELLSLEEEYEQRLKKFL